MLSAKEKKEMLKDAGSEKRRDSFRRAQESVEAASDPSLDAYLKFLTSVHKVFLRTDKSTLKTSAINFKL